VSTDETAAARRRMRRRYLFGALALAVLLAAALALGLGYRPAGLSPLPVVTEPGEVTARPEGAAPPEEGR
jgi:ferric-dicitrate binding protein FerR (iron transport regulator)